MSGSHWLLAGFCATVVLTTLLAASQGLRLTRLSLPFLLGTMVTADRDRAKLVGAAMQLVNGWLFSLVYIALFHVWGGATWWKGALLGAAHAASVLTAGMSVLPSLHPHMASEQEGPRPGRQLEPPGFLALHYGARTPITLLLAHVLFGAVLGAIYR